MKLVTITMLVLLAGCVKIKGEWRSVPAKQYAYDEKYILVAPDDSIIGTISRSTGSPVWSAFDGQHYCGSGDFATMEAAKKCVEDTPWYSR